jgi:hypothetical protein
MVTPPTIDVITVASTAAGVAPTALATAISTNPAAVSASWVPSQPLAPLQAPQTLHAPTLRPTLPLSQPARVPPLAPLWAPLAPAAVVGAPAGIVVGTVADQPPPGLLFLASDVSATASLATSTAGPLDVAAPVGTVAGTAGPWATVAGVGTPA